MTIVADPRRAVQRPGLAVSGGLLAAMTGLVAFVDPHTAGRYPPCLWHAATGTWCPGCGGLRAVHDLVHGHVVAALGENALVVLLAPSLALWWLVLRVRYRGGNAPPLQLTTRGTVVVCMVLAVFTVLRNLPAGAALAP